MLELENVVLRLSVQHFQGIGSDRLTVLRVEVLVLDCVVLVLELEDVVLKLSEQGLYGD